MKSASDGIMKSITSLQLVQSGTSVKKHFDFTRYGIKSVKKNNFSPLSYPKLLHKLSRYRYKEKDVYHKIIQIMYTITQMFVFFSIISNIFLDHRPLNVQHLLSLTLRFIKIMKFVFICAFIHDCKVTEAYMRKNQGSRDKSPTKSTFMQERHT